MILFLSLALCSYQHSTVQDASGCQAMIEAYLRSIDVQSSLDRANKEFIEPLPEDVKKAGAIGYALSQQKLQFRLNKYILLDMAYHRQPGSQDEVYNFLTFRREFR